MLVEYFMQYINGSAQDYGNSITFAIELLTSVLCYTENIYGHQLDKFVVTDGTVSCNNDNLHW